MGKIVPMTMQRFDKLANSGSKRYIFKNNLAGKYTFIALLFFSQFALAENSFYEIHYLLIDTNIEGANYEPNALLYKHIVPYNSFVNLEGIVALGVNEEKSSRKVGIAGTYTQKLIFSNMLGIMVNFTGELEPSVHAYAHFGLARVDYELSTPSWVGGPDGSQNETGLAYGFGIAFNILNTGAFVLEFNELPDVEAGSDTIDTSVISLGYQMPF